MVTLAASKQFLSLSARYPFTDKMDSRLQKGKIKGQNLYENKL